VLARGFGWSPGELLDLDGEDLAYWIGVLNLTHRE
jgi:hypothetical protein